MSHFALWMAPSCVCAETLCVCSLVMGTRRAKRLGQGFTVVLEEPSAPAEHSSAQSHPYSAPQSPAWKRRVHVVPVVC